MTAARALYAAAGALALVALAFRLTGGVAATAPAAAATPAASVQGMTATAALGAQPDPQAFQEIVTSNVFAADRSAPRTRYLARGGIDSVSEARDTTPPPRAREEPRGPRLSGIAITPQATVALIESDGVIAGAKVYQVGDTVAGGRVAAITDSTVVIGGALGRRVLRLHSRATQSHP